MIYQTENEVKTSMEEVLQNISENANFLSSIDIQEIINFVFSMLHTSVVCQKHESFQEEKEWRAIYSPALSNSPLMKSEIEVIGGIPQKVFKMPLDASCSTDLHALNFTKIFDRLIIGPTPYALPMYEAFFETLQDAGVNNVGIRIFISEIPIRT